MRGHKTASISSTVHVLPAADSDVSGCQPNARRCGVACIDWLKFSPVLSLCVSVASTETSMICIVVFKLGLQHGDGVNLHVGRGPSASIIGLARNSLAKGQAASGVLTRHPAVPHVQVSGDKPHASVSDRHAVEPHLCKPGHLKG